MVIFIQGEDVAAYKRRRKMAAADSTLTNRLKLSLTRTKQ